MNSELTAYITLICTSGVLNLYLCLYVFVKRKHYTTIANFFVLYTAIITIYCFASAFGLMSTSLGQIKFWTIMQYAGMPFSPPLGLLFVMQYLGMKMKKRYAALLVIPFISLIMVATNDIHHFHYRVFEIDSSLGAPYLQLEIGIWYMIHGVFTFGCMFVALLLVLSRWKETAKVYRPQLISLVCGQLVPILTAFLYLNGLTPPGVDPVPMVLWLSSLCYLWSIRSSRLFTIMPIAKDAIFHSINDGVMVLDESYRFIEYNQACSRMFPSLDKSMIGKDFEEVWTELAGGAFPFTLEPEAMGQEIRLTSDDLTERFYHLRTSPLHQANNRRGLLLIFSDITEFKRMQVQLEQQAYYDELTQIYNRRAFFQRCERDYTAAKNDSSPFTVILLDVDFFKKVNDTYGHDVGDRLLVHVAKVCQSQLKKGELFARYGGEEFVLGLKGYGLSEGEVLANQLRSHLERHPLLTAEGRIPVTASLGVAEALFERGETLQQVLIKADKALYSAKRAGRNQVHVYTEDGAKSS